MLTLEPPYPVIDGYALLPDHADERLWYAVPAAPRPALSGDGRPQLSDKVALIDTNGFVTRLPCAATTSELLVLNLRTRSIAG